MQIYIRILNRAAEPDFHSPHLFHFVPEDLAEVHSSLSSFDVHSFSLSLVLIHHPSTQLTEAEKVFVKYAEILSQWMWPAGKPRPGEQGYASNGEADMRYAPASNSTATSSGDAAANGNGKCTGSIPVAGRCSTDKPIGHAELTTPAGPYISLSDAERTAEGAVACVEGMCFLHNLLIVCISGPLLLDSVFGGSSTPSLPPP